MAAQPWAGSQTKGARKDKVVMETGPGRGERRDESSGLTSGTRRREWIFRPSLAESRVWEEEDYHLTTAWPVMVVELEAGNLEIWQTKSVGHVIGPSQGCMCAAAAAIQQRCREPRSPCRPQFTVLRHGMATKREGSSG